MDLRTSSTPPLFLEVPVPSQESAQSCICVEFASFYDFCYMCTEGVTKL